MDRSLDEIIGGRQRTQRAPRGGRGGGGGGGRRDNRDNFPRDGVRKSNAKDTRDLDQDWVHDRYDDDEEARPRRGGNQRAERNRSPTGRDSTGYKLKVENLHYEITEDDLRELFERVGPVTNVVLVYDRQDRSTGVAYVTYAHSEDAIQALDDFNGQKAYSQPIYLTMLPSRGDTRGGRGGAAGDSRGTGRSLFERIENPSGGRHGGRRGRDDRSRSPGARNTRHSDVSKPAPEHIDRYVPGQRTDSRRRSPRRGPGGRGGQSQGQGQGRRPGARREQNRTDSGEPGRKVVQGRPRKTQEELDAEMDDYWNQGEGQPQAGNNGAAAAPAAGDDDIDMIE